MSKTHIVLFLASLLTLSACNRSHLLDKRYSPENYNQDLLAITDSGELTAKQSEALYQYIILVDRGFIHHAIAGLTYRQLAERSKDSDFHKYVSPKDTARLPFFVMPLRID
jgi:type III secretory pathway lipoprotein EscJ